MSRCEIETQLIYYKECHARQRASIEEYQKREKELEDLNVTHENNELHEANTKLKEWVGDLQDELEKYRSERNSTTWKNLHRRAENAEVDNSMTQELNRKLKERVKDMEHHAAKWQRRVKELEDDTIPWTKIRYMDYKRLKERVEDLESATGLNESFWRERNQFKEVINLALDCWGPMDKKDTTVDFTIRWGAFKEALDKLRP